MRVKVDHIGAKGDGIAHGPDGPIYIPFAAQGDDVEIRLRGKQGRIKHIHGPSPDRIAPLCRHFGRCGGCSLQHVSAEYYRRWKQQLVRTALGHRGFEAVTILEPRISPKASRRRVRLAAMGRGGGLAVVGFSERASHNIIDLAECPVLEPEIMAFIEPLRKFLGQQLIRRQKMNIQINQAENGLDIILEGRGEPDLDLRMDIAAFADDQDIARICWQDMKLKKPYHEILCERRKPYVTFAGRQLFLPPGSFLQATRAGEAALINFVQASLGDADRLVDIFAGCGTFTVAMIGGHVVHAVEGNREMVTALQQSSRQMGKIRALTTEVRDLFLRPLLPHELNEFDGLIIDPPRAGAQAQIKEIVKSDIGKLVMISCNPASFARDARLLVDGGFIMGDILPIDQFLYSPHLEIAVFFYRVGGTTVANFLSGGGATVANAPT